LGFVNGFLSGFFRVSFRFFWVSSGFFQVLGYFRVSGAPTGEKRNPVLRGSGSGLGHGPNTHPSGANPVGYLKPEPELPSLQPAHISTTAAGPSQNSGATSSTQIGRGAPCQSPMRAPSPIHMAQGDAELDQVQIHDWDEEAEEDEAAAEEEEEELARVQQEIERIRQEQESILRRQATF
jgi:hypothetical protein